MILLNILSIVNTKQYVPAQLQDTYPSYLSQHKDNPIKASYAVISTLVLDTPLTIVVK